jgi:transcriptional regulator with XRE-family HTH domain
METLGKRLRFARETRGLNQSELAEKVGAKPQVIQGLESQKRNAQSSKYLRKIAETLRCDLAWLESGDGTRPKNRMEPKDMKFDAVSDDDLLPAVIMAVEDYFRTLEIVIDPGFKAQAVNKIYHAECAKRAAAPSGPLGFDIADYHDQLAFAKVAFESGLAMMKRRLEPLGVVFDRNYEPKLRGGDKQ